MLLMILLVTLFYTGGVYDSHRRVFSDYNAKDVCNPREHFVCMYLLEVRHLVTMFACSC